MSEEKPKAAKYINPLAPRKLNFAQFLEMGGHRWRQWMPTGGMMVYHSERDPMDSQSENTPIYYNKTWWKVDEIRAKYIEQDRVYQQNKIAEKLELK